MIRKIIHIDEKKCIGCGLCARACHEGAIDMVNGRARLVRENYCDGFGDCLPACPADAISFEEREAPAYDEAAVKLGKQKKAETACPGSAPQKIQRKESEPHESGRHTCPGSAPQKIQRKESEPHESGRHTCPGSAPRRIQKDESVPSQPEKKAEVTALSSGVAGKKETSAFSRLTNWPVQLRLAPVTAPWFDGADLLVAADCSAYAYAAFHEGFLKGRTLLIGCPKLDDADYSEKLTQILRNNRIRSVVVVRMEVPCCGGLEAAAFRALQQSGKDLPFEVTTISLDGRILSEKG